MRLYSDIRGLGWVQLLGFDCEEYSENPVTSTRNQTSSAIHVNIRKINDKYFMQDFGTILTLEWDDFEDFMSKFGPYTNLVVWSIVTACINYYEGIGILVKRGLIDISFIDDLMSGMIIMTWDKFSGYVFGWRELRNYPQFAEYFEYLYYKILIIAEEQHPELKSGIIIDEN